MWPVNTLKDQQLDREKKCASILSSYELNVLHMWLFITKSINTFNPPQLDILLKTFYQAFSNSAPISFRL